MTNYSKYNLYNGHESDKHQEKTRQLDEPR